MATQMHATVVNWASDFITQGAALGAWRRPDLELLSEGRLDGFVAQYEGM